MEVIELPDDGTSDEYFMSLVEAAEADALVAGRSKRQKVSDADAQPREAQEGSYIAALRGSRSSLWQQQQHEVKLQQRKDKSGARGASTVNSSSSLPPSSNAGACFRCGMGGHWARDCTAGRGTEGGGYVNSSGSDVEGVAEKACPCGSGTCLVLISNTAKNPGRKFYRCPLREENGGCNFFEWCNSQSSGFPTSGSVPSSLPKSLAPDLLCPCGAGSCLVLVTKSGKNVGQQYYRCPANEGNSCGFFKWCSEWTSVTGQPVSSSKFHCIQNNSSNQLSGERSGSSCFKCGQEGHWARDCPNQSSASRMVDLGGDRFASSGSSTCFKCNKAGHWARDCPSQDLSSGSTGRNTSRGPYSYN